MMNARNPVAVMSAGKVWLLFLATVRGDLSFKKVLDGVNVAFFADLDELLIDGSHG